jgi:opacity protein-like surface antigen
MSRLKIFTAGLVILAPLGAAHAADMAALPPVVAAPTFVQEYASGWYLRGDLGYRWNDLDGVNSTFGPDPVTSTIDNRFTVGGGGGYKAGWFRADVTMDYSPRTSYTGVTPDYRMKVETFTTLANVYFDLGTWYGFTPYVGAGAGMSWNRTSDYFSNAGFFPGLQGVNVDKAKWDFAWAAMGGVTFSLSPNLLMDVSYRYLNMGDAITPMMSNNVSQFTIKDMTAQEIRVGLRYNLN